MTILGDPLAMKSFWVITPPVGYVDVIVDGQGPWVEEPDVIKIEAETARDAVVLGVKAMLASRAYHYCRDQRCDGLSPYAGVFAVESGRTQVGIET